MQSPEQLEKEVRWYDESDLDGAVEVPVYVGPGDEE